MPTIRRFENLEVWKFERSETWKFGNFGNLNSFEISDLESWGFRKLANLKVSKSGNLEIWKFVENLPENLRIWKFETWRLGNSLIQRSENSSRIRVSRNLKNLQSTKIQNSVYISEKPKKFRIHCNRNIRYFDVLCSSQIRKIAKFRKLSGKRSLRKRSALIVGTCVHSASWRDSVSRSTNSETRRGNADGRGWLRARSREKREEKRRARERETAWKSYEVVKRDRNVGVFNTRLVSVAAKVLGR